MYKVGVLVATLVIAGPAWAGESNSHNSANASAVSVQGQQQGQLQGQKSDIDVQGDKAETGSVIAVAPPSFSYGPGAAVGVEVATESYAIGFPVIGGGFGQQTVEPTPTGIVALAQVLRAAQTDRFLMAATCASRIGRKALDGLNVDCETKPVE